MKKDPDMNLVRETAAKIFNCSVELERVPQGVSTFVYRIKTGGRVYYLRILPEAQNSFAREAAVHDQLIRLGLKVPRVIHYEARNDILGLSLLVVEEIPGSSIKDSPPPAGVESVFFAAGQELALVNQVTVDGFGYLAGETGGRPGEARTFQEYYFKHLSSDLEILPETGFTVQEADSVAALLERAGAAMDRPEPCLAHGDFDATHIFHDQGCYSGIIDFGDILGSSPLFDLGHYKVHDSGKIKGFAPLLAGYKEAGNLTDSDLAEIEVWALFIGVRRLGMIHGRPWHNYRQFLVQSVREQSALVRENGI